MKTQNYRAQVPLSKRDAHFLQVLDQPYTAGSTIQLGERNKLRAIIGFFEILLFLIKAVYRHLKVKKVDAAAVAIDNIAGAMTGEFPDVSLDFSKLTILSGDLASPCAGMNHTTGSNKLSFSWAACTHSNSNQNDELMGMIYCPQKREFWCEQNLGIRRSDGYCTLDVPAEFAGREVHVWLAYRSADQRSNSNSSYMGKVFIDKTDDHENS